MAEAIAGLAVASSIIAVVQLTGRVLSVGWECVRIYQDGAPDLEKLMEELTVFHGVLSTLQARLDKENVKVSELETLTLLEQPCGPLHASGEALVEILETLNSLGSGPSRRLRACISGPRLQKRITKLIDRIERLKSILLLAFHSDQMFACPVPMSPESNSPILLEL